MAKREQAKAAIPYLRQIAEDEYVQKQLRQAATRLRDAYSRGSQGGSRAVEDKKLYRRLREAATSLRRAAGAIEEPPPKPKRRGRKLRVFAFAVVAALIAKRATKAGAAQTHPTGPVDAVPSASQQQANGEPIGAADSA
jgi:hypothetical protein